MNILPVLTMLRESVSGRSVRLSSVASVERRGGTSGRRHTAFRGTFRRHAMWMSVALGVALLPGAAMASTGCAALNLSGHTTGSGTAVGPSASGTYAAGDVVTYTITSFSGGSGYQQLNDTFNGGASNANLVGHQGGTGTFYYTIPSAGAYTFTVVDGSPTGNGATEQIYFTLVCNSAPVPTVTAVTPSSGYTNGGTTVTINGTNFAPGTPAFNVSSVKFGGVAASSFTIVSSTQITAVVPAVASAQTVDVTVSNNTYTSAASASDHFTYTGAAPVPNCLPYDTTAKVAEVIDFSSVGNSASLVKTFNNSNGATNCETQDYGLYTAAQNGGPTTVASDGYSDSSDTVAATTTITGAGGSTITLTGTNNASPSPYDYDLLTVKVGSTNGLTTDTYTVYVTTNQSTVNSSIKFVVNFAAAVTVPGAPTIGTATAGNAAATVSFSAPASNGGAAVTGYTVTSSGGQTATGTGSPLTVTGLTNGTAYTFTVKATNSAGTGPASAASNSVTPSTVPGAPTIGTATAGNASASVSFTAPASNGGSAITSYTVTSSGGQTASGTSSPIVVTGLTNGTAYAFTVKATNVNGTSAASAASNAVTPATVPGAPNIGTATVSGTTAAVAFTAPASNGGAAITSYTVTSSPGGITATGTGSPLTVSGLTYGTAYTFTVYATNSMGSGASSASSNSVTPATVPGAPTIGTATGGNQSTMVAFTAPASNGGSAITSYTATSSPGNITGTATASPITVSGLTNGTAYTFTVYATNSLGNGPASAASNSVTPAVPPVAATATGSGTVLATTAVGSTAAQTAIAFNITSTGTLGPPQVLTQGAANLDFRLGTGSTCTGSALGACQVNVVFAPKYPGQRLGAVNLTDAGGAVIATAFISGTGTGPLLTLSPGLISTVAGNGTRCTTSSTTGCGDGSAATSATLDYPEAAAVDAAGNLYTADYQGYRVRKVTAATGVITTVAGTGVNGYVATQDGAAATSAELTIPTSVAVDGAGNVYIADYARIRKVTAATGIITTVAGNGTSANAASQDGGPATSAGLTNANAVTVDGAGNFYIADFGDNRIREVTVATGIITTVAGNGTHGYVASQDGGLATSAELYSPYGVTVDGSGNLYIADTNNDRIRKVTAATGIITTVAGNGTTAYATSQEGAAATSAGLSGPMAVAVDAAGNLYISDYANQRIRKVTAATGNISTLAGNGTAGYTASQDTGTTAATAASLDYPTGLAVDGAGNLYIADQSNQRIRKVSVTGSIVFPTATAAGTADTTDGTRTLTLNNIGNAALTLASMINNNGSYVLGNPMTGGCSTAVAVAAGGSCILGEMFAPVAGSSGVTNGVLNVTDNSLNVTNNVQSVILSGTTTAGSVTINAVTTAATAGAASTTISVVLSYSGTAADLGAITLTVNGSATGVGTPACTGKGAHKNCQYPYTGTALATAGNYPVAVSVAADTTDGYAAASGTATLTVNGVVPLALPAPRGLVRGPVSAKPLATESVAPVAVPQASVTLSAPVAADDADASAEDDKEKAKQP